MRFTPFRYELARLTDRELKLLLDELSDALRDSEPGSDDRRLILQALDHIRAELRHRAMQPGASHAVTHAR